MSSARRWPRLRRWASRSRTERRAASATEQRARAVGPPRPQIGVMAGRGRGAPCGRARLVTCCGATWAGGAALETGRRAGPTRRGVAGGASPVTWTKRAPATAATSHAPCAAATRTARCSAACCTWAPICTAVRSTATSARLAPKFPELPFQVGDVGLMLGAATARHRRGLRRVMARQQPPRRRHP